MPGTWATTPVIVPTALVIVPVPPVPDAAVGVPYEIVLQVTNSSNLIAWSATGAAWFSIASLTSTTALGSGTPTAPFLGANTIVVQALDAVTNAVGTITL